MNEHLDILVNLWDFAYDVGYFIIVTVVFKYIVVRGVAEYIKAWFMRRVVVTAKEKRIWFLARYNKK